MLRDMRYVLDTDVVCAGMRSPSGASAALLRAALDKHCTLVAKRKFAGFWRLLAGSHVIFAGLMVPRSHLSLCRSRDNGQVSQVGLLNGATSTSHATLLMAYIKN